MEPEYVRAAMEMGNITTHLLGFPIGLIHARHVEEVENVRPAMAPERDDLWKFHWNKTT